MGWQSRNGGIQASTQRNDVESSTVYSIRLLHDLDDSMECVPQWFDDNLQIDAPYPTIERANALVSSGTEERRNHLQECRSLYLRHTKQDIYGDTGPAPKELECTLDGWEHVKKTKTRLSKY